ncbi:MAG: SDR family oxidoreductase [Symbiobacteriia bacterium]
MSATNPERILPCVGDVTKPEDMNRAADLAVSATGRLDVNVGGTLNAIRAVVPVMEQQGGRQVVNVGSLAGRIPVPYSGGYAASKHAQARSPRVRPALPGTISTG